MARIRAIKPGFFKDGDLFDAERATGLPLRVSYAGLWTVADRMGRFKWRPREIKIDVLPYDDVDMVAVLDALVKIGKVLKYKCAGDEYGFICKFLEHQHVNKNEAPSTIPAPPENSNARAKRVRSPSKHHEELTAGVREQEGKGTGREGDCAERAAAPPVILIPTNRQDEEYPVSQAQADEFVSLYPNVDVFQELREMRSWSTTNPTKRKTVGGMPKFMNAWLAKEQDKNGRGTGRTQQQGRGTVEAGERSLAAIRRAAGEADTGGAISPAGAARDAIATTRTTSNTGGIHSGDDGPGRDLSVPDVHDRGEKREASGFLSRHEASAYLETSKGLHALHAEPGEVLSHAGPIARVG